MSLHFLVMSPSLPMIIHNLGQSFDVVLSLHLFSLHMFFLIDVLIYWDLEYQMLTDLVNGFHRSRLIVEPHQIYRVFSVSNILDCYLIVSILLLHHFVLFSLKAYPAATLKKFLPHCTRIIRSMTSGENCSTHIVYQI